MEKKELIEWTGFFLRHKDIIKQEIVDIKPAEDFDFRWTSERAQLEFLLPPGVGEKLDALKIKALRGGPDEIAPPLASVSKAMRRISSLLQ